jgi:GNAT superfamily N-acetyltransferase
MSQGAITAPERITPEHETAAFDSGEATLDEWLRKRALKNSSGGGSRCFVICNGKTVIGYYSLSSGAVAHETAPKNMRRNMPDPLPAMLLGRLAIDRRYHNQGLGSALLRDAMLRTLSISQETGVALMFVHALHDQAKQFYLSRGFVQSPLQPMTLMMTVATVQAIVVEPDESLRAGQLPHG